MKSILELSEAEAYRYFMEPENYCTLDLPTYINFKPVLDYVEKEVENLSLSDIKEKRPSDFDDVNHKLLIKKDAKYTFRPIQLTNPYLYYLLVKLITEKSNWEEIKNRFKVFQRSQIEVSSIPLIKGEKDKSHKASSITSWWENMEQRSLAFSLHYKYMFSTDISNCYASIYTHSIAWALIGKDEAKKRKKEKILANEIDKNIQGMQHGQTNGIPQGSALFDFIAEIVLGYADMLLADKLKNDDIKDYKVLRYRDDYKIFSNSKEDIENIAFRLQEVLAVLNLQLNIKKTVLSEDLIRASIKPDKIAYTTGMPLYKKSGSKMLSTASSLQQEAIYIHQFGSQYPNSGTLIKLLIIFSQRLSKSTIKFKESDVEVMIAIFTDVALASPKVYKLALHLISHLISKFSTAEMREKTVQAIYKKFAQIPNISEVQIWMQHITYQMPLAITFTEPICQIVANKPDVVLWNNDWVKKKYKNNFPQYKICTDWLKDNFTPVINIEEVSLFETY